MRITGVIWLPSIVDKLARKHDVTSAEVEQVLNNRPRFRFSEHGRYAGEDVYVALGQTDSGRYLAIWFVHKKNNEALVVSARDLDAKERKKYGKK